MMGLSDGVGERISMIRSTVLMQHTRVRTDGRTDGIGVAYTRYIIHAVARKNLMRKTLTTHQRVRMDVGLACDNYPTVGDLHELSNSRNEWCALGENWQGHSRHLSCCNYY